MHMTGIQKTAFTLNDWKPGQSVTGIYCGVSYRGTIVEGRNTPDYRNWIFEVELDQPINVFGSERSHLSIWTNAESNTIESADSRFSDPAYLKTERAVNRSEKAMRRNVHI